VILEGVLTPGEAAERWHLSPEAVRKAIRGGRLPAAKSAGTWLIRLSDMVTVFGPEPSKGGKD